MQWRSRAWLQMNQIRCDAATNRTTWSMCCGLQNSWPCKLGPNTCGLLGEQTKPIANVGARSGVQLLAIKSWHQVLMSRVLAECQEAALPELCWFCLSENVPATWPRSTGDFERRVILIWYFFFLNLVLFFFGARLNLVLLFFLIWYYFLNFLWC